MPEDFSVYEDRGQSLWLKERKHNQINKYGLLNSEES